MKRFGIALALVSITMVHIGALAQTPEQKTAYQQFRNFLVNSGVNMTHYNYGGNYGGVRLLKVNMNGTFADWSLVDWFQDGFSFTTKGTESSCLGVGSSPSQTQDPQFGIDCEIFPWTDVQSFQLLPNGGYDLSGTAYHLTNSVGGNVIRDGDGYSIHFVMVVSSAGQLNGQLFQILRNLIQAYKNDGSGNSSRTVASQPSDSPRRSTQPASTQDENEDRSSPSGPTGPTAGVPDLSGTWVATSDCFDYCGESIRATTSGVNVTVEKIDSSTGQPFGHGVDTFVLAWNGQKFIASRELRGIGGKKYFGTCGGSDTEMEQATLSPAGTLTLMTSLGGNITTCQQRPWHKDVLVKR